MDMAATVFRGSFYVFLSILLSFFLTSERPIWAQNGSEETSPLAQTHPAACKQALKTNEPAPAEKDLYFADVSEFMIQKRVELLNNDYRAACGLIAWEIAEMFIAAGESPTTIFFSKDINDGIVITSEPLFPLIFQGRVKWGSHEVAVNRGLVYDPILGYPVRINEYSQLVFGKEIPWSDGLTADYIKRVGMQLKERSKGRRKKSHRSSAGEAIAPIGSEN